MADKVPIRTVFTDGEATGLAEFQSGETVGYVHGGTGLSTIGTAGQILRVNSGATGYEFADGFSANTISLDATADIVLDAGGGNIILKDDTTEFGRFTNSGGQLVIKSSSSSTTAITMSGANVTIAGNLTVTGNTDGDSNITLGDASTDTVTFGGTISGNLVFEGSTDDSFETTLAPGNPSSDITLTLPSSSSDTLVGRDTTDTLTNKTINLTSNTLTGTTTEFNTALSDANFVTQDGSGNVTVSGNLTVNGTTTTINTETINLADNTIVLNSNATGSASENGGIEIERGDDTNKTLIWNETTDKWTVGSETFVAGTFEGDLTGDVTGDVTGNVTGNLTGDVTGNADTATALATARNIGGVSFDGTANINLPGVNTTGNQDTSGNAATATTLETARTIAGQSFDGSANITIASTDLSNTSNITLNDGSQTLTNKTLTSPNISGLTLTDSSVIFEGSTADSFETTLTVEDPTVDRTITLPNATGSLITHGQFSGDATVGSDGAITLATVNSDTSAVGSTTEIPVITANAKGLVTSISTASISTVLTLSADSGSNDNVTVGSDTLNFEGGTGITTTVSNNNIKIDLASSPTVTSLILEGATADSFETTLAVSDPTADRTLTLPNKSGTIATTDDISFPNSTTATHPAAESNADLADGETPFETSIDAFAVSTGTNYDQMDPAGSIVTIDLGSVA